MQDTTQFRKEFVQQLLRIANLGSVGAAVTGTLMCSEQSEQIGTTANQAGAGGADAADVGARGAGGSGGSLFFDSSAGTAGSGARGMTPEYCDAATPFDSADPRE